MLPAHPLHEEPTSLWIAIPLTSILSFVAFLPFAAFTSVAISSTKYEGAQLLIAQSNTRMIAQSAIIFAADNQDNFPQAETITDYAIALAREGGLNDLSIWDANAPENSVPPGTIIGANRLPHPGLNITSAHSVLSGGSLKLPLNTPLVWTTGLQPDGYWSPDSPYEGQGGFIAKVDGTVYKHLRKDGPVTFPRYDGQGTTSDIREALPPNSRILEGSSYTPKTTAWKLPSFMEQWFAVLLFGWMFAMLALNTRSILSWFGHGRGIRFRTYALALLIGVLISIAPHFIIEHALIH
jgi:hypothetical protein